MNSNRTPANAPANQVNQINVGLELQRLRLRQTRTIEAIAEALKLTTDMVNHLENNNFDKLPNKVFVRGYIRNYLNLLDVPKARADDLIAQFNRSIDHSTEAQSGHRLAIETEHQRQDLAHRRIKLMGDQQQYKIDSSGARWKIWVALAAIALMMVLGWLLFIDPAAEPPSSASVDSQVNLLSSIDIDEVQPVSSAEPLIAPASPVEPPEALAIPLTSTELIIDELANAVVDTGVGAAPQPLPSSINDSAALGSEQPEPESEILLPMGSLPETAQILQPDPALRLVLNFREESWIQVGDGSGEILIDGVYQLEDVINLNAVAPVNFHLGNSAATSIVYQGRELDYSAFISRNVARFTLEADGTLTRFF